MAEVKKGRYVYYHCTGYRGKCPEPYTREETLQCRFAERLRELVIPHDVIEWLQDELVTSDMNERASREQAIRRYQAELDRLQGRFDILYDDRLDGRIDASTYEESPRNPGSSAACPNKNHRVSGGEIGAGSASP